MHFYATIFVVRPSQTVAQDPGMCKY